MSKKSKKSTSKNHKVAPRSIRRMFPQVKTVIDAKHAVTVSVRKADCDKAEPLNPRECALARASMRQFHAEAAVIGMGSSYIIKGSKAIRFKTPGSVQREIVSFDRHNDFEPGEYHLPPMSPSIRFGAKSRGNKGGNHKSKRIIHKTTSRTRLLATKQ